MDFLFYLILLVIGFVDAKYDHPTIGDSRLRKPSQFRYGNKKRPSHVHWYANYQAQVSRKLSEAADKGIQLFPPAKISTIALHRCHPRKPRFNRLCLQFASHKINSKSIAKSDIAKIELVLQLTPRGRLQAIRQQYIIHVQTIHGYRSQYARFTNCKTDNPSNFVRVNLTSLFPDWYDRGTGAPDSYRTIYITVNRRQCEQGEGRRLNYWQMWGTEISVIFNISSGPNKPLLAIYSSNALKLIDKNDEKIVRMLESYAPMAPLMNVEDNEEGDNPKKRNPKPVRDSDCQLKPIVINVKNHLELKYDEPEEINTNYCAGECRGTLGDSDWNSTAHAIFLAKYRLKSADNDVSAASCVPISYRGITMKEITADQTDDTSIPNAIATQCGCR